MKPSRLSLLSTPVLWAVAAVASCTAASAGVEDPVTRGWGKGAGAEKKSCGSSWLFVNTSCLSAELVDGVFEDVNSALTNEPSLEAKKVNKKKKSSKKRNISD